MLQKNRRSYLSPTCLSVTKSPAVVRNNDRWFVIVNGDFETAVAVAKPEHRFPARRIRTGVTRKSLTGLSKLQASFLMARNVGRLHESENTTGEVPENSPDVVYTGEHIRVQCLPLTLYIAALGIKTVDYFSLDIEGNEIDVLETIPFNEVDIKVRRFPSSIPNLHFSVCTTNAGSRDASLVFPEAERNDFRGTMITRYIRTF